MMTDGAADSGYDWIGVEAEVWEGRFGTGSLQNILPIMPNAARQKARRRHNGYGRYNRKRHYKEVPLWFAKGIFMIISRFHKVFIAFALDYYHDSPSFIITTGGLGTRL